MAAVDFMLKGGRVLDPANGVDGVCDVAVKDGIIVRVGRDLAMQHFPACRDQYDFEGCIICPGLVDCHVHTYEYCTPLGVNPDLYCLSRGVTTAVDAGSAGASTFPGFRKFIAGACETRMLAFLHIAAHGMAAAGCAGFGAGGECDSLNQVDKDMCCRCIHDNKDMIVGVKVRLTANVANDGRNEEEIYRRALAAAEEANIPLMTHHTMSTIPTQGNPDTKMSCPGSLRPGDVYTHTMHGYPSTIIDPETLKIHPDVLEARRRGVFFDLGHGQGSFVWTVAEMCAAQGFWPDIISTDLHSGNINGPVYDLPTTMSKMLHVGMPLNEVIKAVTLTPAKAIKRSHMIGSLGVGQVADITVLRLEACDLDLEDSLGQVRHLVRRLHPVGVWKGGKKHEITKAEVFPNKQYLPDLAKSWNQLVVHDSTPPAVHIQ